MEAAIVILVIVLILAWKAGPSVNKTRRRVGRAKKQIKTVNGWRKGRLCGS